MVNKNVGFLTTFYVLYFSKRVCSLNRMMRFIFQYTQGDVPNNSYSDLETYNKGGNETQQFYPHHHK